VFGDVHDIGKSLVNTILTNNGYTVRRPRQAGPDLDDHRRAKEHDATAIGLSALLVSTSKQMPAVHPGAALAGPGVPVLDRRRAINRDFGLRALYPAAPSPTTSTSPASSTARTPSRA
jgi:5-methyltetrahydrofolate--homocysteine methyltransferase